MAIGFNQPLKPNLNITHSGGYNTEKLFFNQADILGDQVKGYLV